MREWVEIRIGKDCFTQWRTAARRLFIQNVAPHEIDWRCAPGGFASGLFEKVAQQSHDKGPSLPGREAPHVPSAFLDLAEVICCHSSPLRLSLLYRLLWRLQEEKRLLSLITDPDVHEARMMAKSVRRDCHKMKAFLRFKEVGAPDRRPRRSFFAWFEPDHHVVARTAPFFQRRFTDMDWVIATPKGSAIWDGKELKLSDAPQANPGIVDETDDLWRTYFRNIFNPARLKIKAMQAEMPRKYWKNMPEAELIPELISGAEVRVREMAQAMATQPPLLHHRIKEAQAMATPKANVLNEGLEGVRQAAETCTRCPLYCNATQTVFGEGPENAGTMLVGEQPGDQEDLTGRPFVGPAGKLLEGVLSDVGLKRDKLYVTNAVKHFKFEPRGKRRIHQKPNMSEIKACRWWLTQELELVRPKIVVAMGATALSSLVEKRYKLSDLRGEAMEREDGGQLFVTVHPSYLLRIPDQGKKREEMQRFRDDLAKIRALGERAP